MYQVAGGDDKFIDGIMFSKYYEIHGIIWERPHPREAGVGLSGDSFSKDGESNFC